MDMLVADLGGTQSRFFMFSCEDKEISIKKGIVLSSRISSFDALLGEFCTSWPDGEKSLSDISWLIFAAAGPVRDGRVTMTNASFVVDKAVVEARFPGKRCLVMNDFEAQAWACLTPVMREAEQILPGHLSGSVQYENGFAALSGTFGDTSPVAVTGAGTGLGAAWLIPGRGGCAPFVLPSEAGHAAFPFESEEERRFASFLAERRGGWPVTWEHVLSGQGLALLYEYLCGRSGEPSSFTRETGFADSHCCRLFARFYGRFCRTVALTLLPQAMVLTGGVAGKTPALVRHPEFSREFFRSVGGQRAFLERLPVWLNIHPQAGLWGAARAAVENACVDTLSKARA